MSVRSELRAQLIDRYGEECWWPHNNHQGRLEMAHLVQLSQGGPDELWNVVLLCQFHHGVLDNRVQNGRREATVQLLQMYLVLARL